MRDSKIIICVIISLLVVNVYCQVDPVVSNHYYQSFGGYQHAGTQYFHDGVDLRASVGDPVYSPVTGKIAGLSQDPVCHDYTVSITVEISPTHYFYYQLSHIQNIPSVLDLAAISQQLPRAISSGDCLGAVIDNIPPHIHY